MLKSWLIMGSSGGGSLIRFSPLAVVQCQLCSPMSFFLRAAAPKRPIHGMVGQRQSVMASFDGSSDAYLQLYHRSAQINVSPRVATPLLVDSTPLGPCQTYNLRRHAARWTAGSQDLHVGYAKFHPRGGLPKWLFGSKKMRVSSDINELWSDGWTPINMLESWFLNIQMP